MKQLNKLDIKEIRNNSVIFNDGVITAVLKLQIPNFNKLNTVEQLKRIASYRLWLSSIDHKIQICARTVNEDISENVSNFQKSVEQKLKQKKDYKDGLLELRRFCRWLHEYASNNAPSMRLYYVVIPFSPYYRKKKDVKKMIKIEDNLHKLNKKVATAINLLKNVGIHAARMSDKELINLYSSFFTFSFYNKEGYFDTIESCVNKWGEI